MKTHGAVWLTALGLLTLLGSLLSPANQVWADDALRLMSVEFPKECKGQCDVVLKVEGDLRSVKDLVAEVKYHIERQKGARQGKIDFSTKKHKATSVDIVNGVVNFHASFRGPSKRIATCTLQYVKNGRALQTNEVTSSWFEVTERGLMPVEGAVQRKKKSDQ